MNFYDQDDFEAPYQGENDEFVFECYEMAKIEQPSTDVIEQQEQQKKERKERILKKRIEKKEKINKNQVKPNLSKEELRKLRNRNSAQLSRDRKKLQFESLIGENENFKNQIKIQEEQICRLIQENDQYKQRIELLEELNQNYQCLNCAQPHMTRVNIINKSKMMNYGLLSLLTITCIVTLLNNEQVYTSPSPISFQQIQDKHYDFLSPINHGNSTSIQTYNSLAIPDHSYNNQTLFYNCTGNEKECQTFLNIIKAENADNIYFVNDAIPDDTVIENNHYFDKGENVYLIKIKQDDEDNFMIFRARCQITESNQIMIERESYDTYNNSLQL